MKPAARFLMRGLALVAVATAAGEVGVVEWSTHLAHERTLAALGATRNIAARLQAHELEALRLRADNLALDPAFVDYVAQSLIPNPAMGNTVDSLSITDLLNERRHGYDTALVLDADGRPVARSGQLFGDAGRIQRDALVAQAMATRKAVQGVWADHGAPALVVVEPLLRSGALQGLLVAAKRLGSGFATEVGDLSHTGVALLATSSQASDMLPSNDADLGMMQALAKVKLTDLPATGRLERLPTGSRTMLTWVSPLRMADGTAALAAFDDGNGPDAIWQAWPLLLGVLALGLVAAGITVRHWRRVVRPLQQMSDIVELGARGDHHLNVRVDGSAGVNRLRDAINSLFAHERSTESTSGWVDRREPAGPDGD